MQFAIDSSSVSVVEEVLWNASEEWSCWMLATVDAESLAEMCWTMKMKMMWRLLCAPHPQ